MSEERNDDNEKCTAEDKIPCIWVGGQKIKIRFIGSLSDLARMIRPTICDTDEEVQQ